MSQKSQNVSASHNRSKCGLHEPAPSASSRALLCDGCHTSHFVLTFQAERPTQCRGQCQQPFSIPLVLLNLWLIFNFRSGADNAMIERVWHKYYVNKYIVLCTISSFQFLLSRIAHKAKGVIFLWPRYLWGLSFIIIITSVCIYPT